MTAARHANDAHMQSRTLRLHMQQLLERARAGTAPSAEELNAAFQLARIAEHHASRAMVAIAHSAGRAGDASPQEGLLCL